VSFCVSVSSVSLKAAIVNKISLERGHFIFAMMQSKQLLCWIRTQKRLKSEQISKDMYNKYKMVILSHI
jgi:hypothetical protein